MVSTHVGSTLPITSHHPFSIDTGDAIGVTVFRQPPDSSGAYPSNQIRRWWVRKDEIPSYTLEKSVKEIKCLFKSRNTYQIQYFDGFHMMTMATDKDLTSCLTFFLANSNRPDVCQIYLEEKLTEKTSEVQRFKVRIAVPAKEASAVTSISQAINQQSNQRKGNSLTADQRMATFKARVLNKHGCKAEVVSKNTLKCLYDRCGKQVACKEFNQQNFDTHVKLCHSSKHQGSDIRLMLTLIAQNEEKAAEEVEAQPQLTSTEEEE